MSSADLRGKICVVTGATKGIGKGIALQLGTARATVYITGRTKSLLDEVAKEIDGRGGKAIPVVVDHSNDAEVENFFKKIEKDEKGKLDVLVNNAFSAVNTILSSIGKPFWTLDPVEQWDSINGVGLRNHYLCSVYASRIMVKNKSGLIVNISSYGGWQFIFNVPYVVGKSACDRMAADGGIELKKENVTMVSLWPGAVKTEAVGANLARTYDMESTEFPGMAVAHLAADSNKIAKSGRILLTSDLAKEYGFKDLDGTISDGFSKLNKKSWLANALNK